mmetsp:Transcript_19878/g.58491  ORF Transcript_19878/g.58491 Transcript_19878/m.58491 type:complete len:240 (-) Transcript_19878:144-863(-)
MAHMGHGVLTYAAPGCVCGRQLQPVQLDRFKDRLRYPVGTRRRRMQRVVKMLRAERQRGAHVGDSTLGAHLQHARRHLAQRGRPLGELLTAEELAEVGLRVAQRDNGHTRLVARGVERLEVRQGCRRARVPPEDVVAAGHDDGAAPRTLAQRAAKHRQQLLRCPTRVGPCACVAERVLVAACAVADVVRQQRAEAYAVRVAEERGVLVTVDIGRKRALKRDGFVRPNVVVALGDRVAKA